MFGVYGGAGVVSPFAGFSSPTSPSVTPKTNSNVRYSNNTNEQYTTMAPFRDDTRLVALRYDQTVALEPPIPLPPPRSPLRPPRHATPGSPIVSAANSPTIAPHHPAVPRRPPPPTEQHPALRTITSPGNFNSDTRRDSVYSVHSPTISSRLYNYQGWNDSDEENIDNDDDDNPYVYGDADGGFGVQPLRLRAHSVGSSVYSLQEWERDFKIGHEPKNRGYILPRGRGRGRERERDGERGSEDAIEGERVGAGGAERASEADSSRKDITTATTAVTATAATATAATASTRTRTSSSSSSSSIHFPKRFGRGSFGLRSNSFKSSASSMNRLRKKSQAEGEAKDLGAGKGSGKGTGKGSENGKSNPTVPSPSLSSPSTSSPLHPPPNHPSRPTNPVHPSNSANNHNASAARPNASATPPSSPTISTKIPCESFFEDDDLSKLSFSIRGSLIFGSKRLRKTSASTSSSSVNHKMADKDPRAFPLVPTAAKKDHHGSAAPARPPREDDMGLPESPHLHQPSQSGILSDAAIRVISTEAEKESQKVRSLYESGACIQLGDGDVPLLLGGTCESAPEVPSGVDGNDAPNDRPLGHRPHTSATTSSAVPRGNRQRAWSTEDWEGVSGRDIDRYGFIVSNQTESISPPGTAIQNGSPPGKVSSRRRNLLIKKGPSSLSLSAKRGPTRDVSARSLHTYTSEVSVISRRSVRSTIRQAANKLPYNKDRRLIDEAGDLLALQPGLSNTTEDEEVKKMSAELKRKEASRSDKWRKMAKIVKPGSEGQGTIFHFDAKHPKLIERTWKGIPDCWRSAAWYSFLATSAKADPANYVSDEDLTAAFRRLLEEPSPDDTQIDLDVPRTINQHILFRRRYRGGQRLLFRVLHAMSLYFPETGYVQGMAPLAATLLSYYDEEQCFIMLARLWQFRGLNRIYQSGFVELMGALKDFETHWLNGKDVAANLKELCIDPTAYATRWYLTLFNLSIPFPVQLRVWDVFMLLGSSPPERQENSPAADKELEGHPSSQGLEVLHATSLAIIDTLHAALIDSDFENAMKSLTSWVPIKDEQRFLEVVQVEWKKHHNRQKKKS
ncbi:rab-GTPase-TBC domain-containing protein [Xylaria intraflava]|nr:rab-GTPase-TBC domain-containing protein [Xylaria intraflava]